MKSALAAAALRNAIALHSPDATIVHSDRGSQFRSKKVLRLLKNNGLNGSMGRVGSSSDNAAMNSLELPISSRVGRSVASAGDPDGSMGFGIDALIDGILATQQIHARVRR